MPEVSREVHAPQAQRDHDGFRLGSVHSRTPWRGSLTST